MDAVKNNARVRRLFGKPPIDSLGDDVRLHPLDEVTRHAADAGFETVWRRFGLHPISALWHNAGYALIAQHYRPGARRELNAAVYSAITAIRPVEDGVLAPLPTGYLYAALFRKVSA